MNLYDHTKQWLLRIVILLVVGFLFLKPVTVLALQPCETPAVDICLNPGPQDCDQDGFTDSEECSGFHVLGSGSTACIPGYQDTTCISANDVDFTLNPEVPDLIYVVTNTETPYSDTLPANSLLLTALGSDPNSALKLYDAGLHIRAHRIKKSQIVPTRWLTSKARAAEIKESSDASPYLGETASYSVPATNNGSIIYTKKIKDVVDGKCSNEPCDIANTSPLITNQQIGDGIYDNTEIINYYILQVISHEVGHGSRLAPTTAKSSYHYRGSDTIMGPAASYRRGVYKIATEFDPSQDPKEAQLLP